MAATRSAGNQRRYPRSTLRRLGFIRAAQRVGLSLDEIADALATLPSERTPTKRDWQRLSRHWRGRIEEQIDRLERLRDRLDSCIGCGCLSLRTCALSNPGDELARRPRRGEPGARRLRSAPVGRPRCPTMIRSSTTGSPRSTDGGPPSSSGPGPRPFTAVARVRIPLGVRCARVDRERPDGPIRTSARLLLEFPPLATHGLRPGGAAPRGPVAQLVSAPPCHGGGRGFESRRGRHQQRPGRHRVRGVRASWPRSHAATTPTREC